MAPLSPGGTLGHSFDLYSPAGTTVGARVGSWPPAGEPGFVGLTEANVAAAVARWQASQAPPTTPEAPSMSDWGGFNQTNFGWSPGEVGWDIIEGGLQLGFCAVFPDHPACRSWFPAPGGGVDQPMLPPGPPPTAPPPGYDPGYPGVTTPPQLPPGGGPPMPDMPAPYAPPANGGACPPARPRFVKAFVVNDPCGGSPRIYKEMGPVSTAITSGSIRESVRVRKFANRFSTRGRSRGRKRK